MVRINIQVNSLPYSIFLVALILSPVYSVFPSSLLSFSIEKSLPVSNFLPVQLLENLIVLFIDMSRNSTYYNLNSKNDQNMFEKELKHVFKRWRVHNVYSGFVGNCQIRL